MSKVGLLIDILGYKMSDRKVTSQKGKACKRGRECPLRASSCRCDHSPRAFFAQELKESKDYKDYFLAKARLTDIAVRKDHKDRDKRVIEERIQHLHEEIKELTGRRNTVDAALADLVREHTFYNDICNILINRMTPCEKKSECSLYNLKGNAADGIFTVTCNKYHNKEEREIMERKERARVGAIEEGNRIIKEITECKKDEEFYFKEGFVGFGSFLKKVYSESKEAPLPDELISVIRSYCTCPLEGFGVSLEEAYNFMSKKRVPHEIKACLECVEAASLYLEPLCVCCGNDITGSFHIFHRICHRNKKKDEKSSDGDDFIAAHFTHDTCSFELGLAHARDDLFRGRSGYLKRYLKGDIKIHNNKEEDEVHLDVTPGNLCLGQWHSTDCGLCMRLPSSWM